MTTDFRPLRDRLEAVFSDMLTPDLQANGADRVHIVLISETDLATSGEFAGMTSPYIGRWLKCYIANWQWASPVMLIDDLAIARQSWSHREYKVAELIAVASHELGHIVCTPGLFARDDELPDAPGEGKLFAKALNMPSAKFSLAARSTRAGHGPDFLRSCCHIRHRLVARGIECLMPMMVQHDYYAISPLAQYVRALNGECEQLANVTLTTIQATPIPQTFLDLHADDLARWPIV